MDKNLHPLKKIEKVTTVCFDHNRELSLFSVWLGVHFALQKPVDWGDQLTGGTSKLGYQLTGRPVDWEDQLTGRTSRLDGLVKRTLDSGSGDAGAFERLFELHRSFRPVQDQDPARVDIQNEGR